MTAPSTCGVGGLSGRLREGFGTVFRTMTILAKVLVMFHF